MRNSQSKVHYMSKLERKAERPYPPLSDDARKQSNNLIELDQIKSDLEIRNPLFLLRIHPISNIY